MKLWFCIEGMLLCMIELLWLLLKLCFIIVFWVLLRVLVWVMLLMLFSVLLRLCGCWFCSVCVGIMLIVWGIFSSGVLLWLIEVLVVGW